MPILAFALVLGAVAPPPAAASIDRAVAAYDAAQVHGDRKALETLLADDYVLANSGGATQTKEEFIADLTDPTYHLEPFHVLKAVERTWSDGAIRGGLVRLTGQAGGKPFAACLRFVDVWRRNASGWRVAYSQAARAPDTACSSG